MLIEIRGLLNIPTKKKVIHTEIFALHKNKKVPAKGSICKRIFEKEN